jgi:hypothetical protein
LPDKDSAQKLQDQLVNLKLVNLYAQYRDYLADFYIALKVQADALNVPGRESPQEKFGPTFLRSLRRRSPLGMNALLEQSGMMNVQRT